MNTRHLTMRRLVVELLDGADAQKAHPELDEISFDPVLLKELTGRAWIREFQVPLADALREEFDVSLHALDSRARLACALGLKLERIRYQPTVRPLPNGLTSSEGGQPLFAKYFWAEDLGSDPLFDAAPTLN
jgi:hypothetical protein